MGGDSGRNRSLFAGPVMIGPIWKLWSSRSRVGCERLFHWLVGLVVREVRTKVAEGLQGGESKI